MHSAYNLLLTLRNLPLAREELLLCDIIRLNRQIILSIIGPCLLRASTSCISVPRLLFLTAIYEELALCT